MSSLPLALLGDEGGFRPDPRFDPAPLPQPAGPDPVDPVVAAWNEGHAAGRADALEAAQTVAAQNQAAVQAIELSLARLDEALAESLRDRLHATIAALCEAMLAPFAIDREALATRVSRAAALLARADDDKILRLHPDDLSLIRDRLPEGLDVMADPALERGAVRIETASGGVEDGPAHWRRAIAEALAQC
jgi:flagellar assembly protein FliH